MSTLFTTLSDNEKEQAVKSLIESSSPRHDFFFLVGLSMLMAAAGLILDSTAIVIGSMLVAPLLYPFLSLSLGVVNADRKLIYRSFVTLIKSTILGIALSALVALFFSGAESFASSRVAALLRPSLLYALVAVSAGLAATFAFIKPHLSNSLPGVAISVALIPPIAAIGIGLSGLNWLIIRDALALFFLNGVGIVLSSMVIFSLMKFYQKRQVVKEEVKKDEKEIKKEVVKAKQSD
jgi:uncharacterized hydrophobic protein (TIGR00271 family)